MYSDRKKNVAKMDDPKRKPTTLAPVTLRFRKMRNGRIGSLARASITTKLTIKRRQLRVEEVDRRERRLDDVVTGRRELDRSEPFTRGGLRDLTTDRDPVMEQLCVDPLQPSASLVRDRLAQLHPAAQLE